MHTHMIMAKIDMGKEKSDFFVAGPHKLTIPYSLKFIQYNDKML